MSVITTFPGIRDSVVYPFCYEMDHHSFRHIEFVSMWSANMVTMSCLGIHAYLLARLFFIAPYFEAPTTQLYVSLFSSTTEGNPRSYL